MDNLFFNKEIKASIEKRKAENEEENILKHIENIKNLTYFNYFEHEKKNKFKIDFNKIIFDYFFINDGKIYFKTIYNIHRPLIENKKDLIILNHINDLGEIKDQINNILDEYNTKKILNNNHYNYEKLFNYYNYELNHKLKIPLLTLFNRGIKQIRINQLLNILKLPYGIIQNIIEKEYNLLTNNYSIFNYFDNVPEIIRDNNLILENYKIETFKKKLFNKSLREYRPKRSDILDDRRNEYLFVEIQFNKIYRKYFLNNENYIQRHKKKFLFTSIKFLENAERLHNNSYEDERRLERIFNDCREDIKTPSEYLFYFDNFILEVFKMLINNCGFDFEDIFEYIKFLFRGGSGAFYAVEEGEEIEGDLFWFGDTYESNGDYFEVKLLIHNIIYNIKYKKNNVLKWNNTEILQPKKYEYLFSNNYLKTIEKKDLIRLMCINCNNFFECEGFNSFYTLDKIRNPTYNDITEDEKKNFCSECLERKYFKLNLSSDTEEESEEAEIESGSEDSDSGASDEDEWMDENA